MRRAVGIALLAFALAAHASSDTLRVGSQVLVVGDSATRVVELLGKPAYKTHDKGAESSRSKGSKASKGKSGKSGKAGDAGGEQWQYRQGSRVVTVVVANGRVVAIRDGGR